MPPIKRTRLESEVFLLGQPQDKPRIMAKPLTNGDMLRYLHYRKNLDKSKAWDWETVCSSGLVKHNAILMKF